MNTISYLTKLIAEFREKCKFFIDQLNSIEQFKQWKKYILFDHESHL